MNATALSILVAALVGAATIACVTDSRAQAPRPIQLGRPISTPTPRPPGPRAVPPQCGEPAIAIVSHKLEPAVPSTNYVISGEAKSSCDTPVEVTLFVSWLDGTDAPDEPRAFASLLRMTPRESRPFREVVAGPRNATRVTITADWGVSQRTRQR